MTRAGALAPLLVGAMTETAAAAVDAPPVVTHQGMVTTYRSHDQMMAVFAADMATGKWECDAEDRRKLAEWQAARMRKAPRPCQARRQRSRTSHRRATRGCSTRRSTKACSSDPDGGSCEPPGPRHLAIRGALDVDDSLERASAPTLRSASAPIRSSTTKRGRSDVCAAVAELGQGYVLSAASGSELGGGESITLSHDGRRRYHATAADGWGADGFADGTGRTHEMREVARSAGVPLSSEPICDSGGPW